MSSSHRPSYIMIVGAACPGHRPLTLHLSRTRQRLCIALPLPLAVAASAAPSGGSKA